MSSAVTSSHRQAKQRPLPRAAPDAAAGTASLDRLPQAAQGRPIGLEPGRVVLVTEPELDRGLRPRDRARGLGSVCSRETGDRAGGVDARRRLLREVGAGGVVPAGLGPGLEQQRRRRHRPAGDGDEVAVDAAFAVGRSSGRPRRGRPPPRPSRVRARTRGRRPCRTSSSILASAIRCSSSSLAPAGASVGDGGDLHACITKSQRRLDAAVGGRRDHGHVPGPHSVEGGQARAPEHSITPGRSLPSNIRGCSIEPVAATWARARTWCSVLPAQTGTIPSKNPSAAAGASTSTPAARTRAASARASSARSLASRLPPSSGPSSTRVTSAPSSAGAQRGRHPGHAASDHEHVGVAAAVLGAPFPLGLAAGQPAEASGVPQDLS